MKIYYAFLALSAFITLIEHIIWHKNYVSIVLSGIMLFIISGFRHFKIGNDTQRYIQEFLDMRNITLQKAIDLAEKEKFYSIFVKLIADRTDDYTVFLCIIAAIFIISLCIFILKYSKESYMSFVIFIALSYFYFTMTGIRQTLAMAIVMFSYPFLRERKIIPFILIVALASLFHNSALIFLISYPIAYISISWKNFVAIITAFFLATFCKPIVYFFLFNVLKWDRLDLYNQTRSSLSMSGFIIQFFIMIFCMVYYRMLVKNNNRWGVDKTIQQRIYHLIFIKSEPKSLPLYNLMFCGLFFQAFAPVVGEFFRISMYFSIFNIALIPNCIAKEEDEGVRIIIYLGVLGLVLAYYYFCSGNDSNFAPYRFYWMLSYFK